MPIIVTPYIPTYITVHLGTPDSDAENLTISFREYIKNVASSEVYPTWHNSALRANILAQVSFALNRVYTEFYPSQGYSFNITASTAYDQKFIKGRNIFDSVSTLVDELFTVYIRRQGFVEPLAASFCNGTTTVCDGLSQWGSENIELVTNAPMQDIQYSYPGAPLRLGDISPEVQVAQIMINRISVAYPAIPKIWQVDGIFSSSTEDAVRELQHIFNLTVDGIIGKSTWYMMVHLYTGILRLSELVSEGQTFFQLDFEYHQAIVYGQRGESVTLLQYLLSILAQFYLTIPFLTIDGVFGDETQAAVQALQLDAGLPQTGTVDEETWDVIIDRFIGIDRTVLSNPKFFMSTSLPPAFSLGPVSTLQEMLRTIAFVNRSLPFLRPTGRFDEETLEAVMMFQKINGFPVTGIVDRRTWDAIMNAFLQAYSHLAPPRTVTIFSQGAEPIHPGQSSPLLRPLQDMFRALAEILEGIASTPSTGVLDEDTTANLRWLQGHSGLPQTGVLDQNTWEMLVRLFETFVSQKPVQKIDNNQQTHL